MDDMKLVIDIPDIVGKEKSRLLIILREVIKSEIIRLFDVMIGHKSDGVLFFKTQLGDVVGIAKYIVAGNNTEYGYLTQNDDEFSSRVQLIYSNIIEYMFTEELILLLELCDFEKTDLMLDKKRESKILYKPK